MESCTHLNAVEAATELETIFQAPKSPSPQAWVLISDQVEARNLRELRFLMVQVILEFARRCVVNRARGSKCFLLEEVRGRLHMYVHVSTE